MLTLRNHFPTESFSILITLLVAFPSVFCVTPDSATALSTQNTEITIVYSADERGKIDPCG